MYNSKRVFIYNCVVYYKSVCVLLCVPGCAGLCRACQFAIATTHHTTGGAYA